MYIIRYFANPKKEDYLFSYHSILIPSLFWYEKRSPPPFISHSPSPLATVCDTTNLNKHYSTYFHRGSACLITNCEAYTTYQTIDNKEPEFLSSSFIHSVW